MELLAICPVGLLMISTDVILRKCFSPFCKMGENQQIGIQGEMRLFNVKIEFASPWFLQQKPSRIFFSFGLLQKISSVTNKTRTKLQLY